MKAIGEYSLEELKQLARQNKIKISGKKAELYERLVDNEIAGLMKNMEIKKGPKKNKKEEKPKEPVEKPVETKIDFVLPDYSLFGDDTYVFSKEAKKEVDVLLKKLVPYIVQNYSSLTNRKEEWIADLLVAGKEEARKKKYAPISSHSLGQELTGMIEYIIDVFKWEESSIIEVDAYGNTETKIKVSLKTLQNNTLYRQLKKLV